MKNLKFWLLLYGFLTIGWGSSSQNELWFSDGVNCDFIRKGSLISTETSAVEEEFLCLACNIYFESRGESNLGQRMVANVTLNRLAHSKRFPSHSICDVVWSNNQFSWTSDGKHDLAYGDDWTRSLFSALKALEEVSQYGQAWDPTRCGDHYHADWIHDPNWASGMSEKVAKVGKHVFYIENNQDCLKNFDESIPIPPFLKEEYEQTFKAF